MKLINRSQYLQKLINVIGTPDVKVITGVRCSYGAYVGTLYQKEIGII